MGGALFPPYYLTWDQTMAEVMKIMATSFKRSPACPVTLSALTLQQAAADPRHPRRLLDTHRQVWACLLWGLCSFLLAPGAHKVLFVPSKHLFPQSYVSSVKIPLASKVKFPGISQSLCQIPRLENLLWVLELS